MKFKTASLPEPGARPCLVNMRSDHEVIVTDEVKEIMVKLTITSNKLEVTNQLPANWDKHECMK